MLASLTTAVLAPESLLTVTLGGQIIVGFCVSMTVTVNVQVIVLPTASVAVEVTVVVPYGKLLPEPGLEINVTPGQLSVAVTVKVTLLEHAPPAVLTVIFAGHV